MSDQLTSISTAVGLGVQSIAAVFQGYVTFKQTNIEKFFKLLLNENTDLSNIGSDQKLTRLFFRFMEAVSLEVIDEKIEKWKNLIVNFSLGNCKMDFAENYTKIMETLTAFDLAVLYKIYTTEFENRYFYSYDLKAYYEQLDVARSYIEHSITALANVTLIDSLSSSQSVPRHYFLKNDLGKEFLQLISL